MAALRGEHVDPSANPVQRGLPRSIAQAQLPALPLCDGMRQNLGNEIRKIVGVVLLPCPIEFSSWEVSFVVICVVHLGCPVFSCLVEQYLSGRGVIDHRHQRMISGIGDRPSCEHRNIRSAGSSHRGRQQAIQACCLRLSAQSVAELIIAVVRQPLPFNLHGPQILHAPVKVTCEARVQGSSPASRLACKPLGKPIPNFGFCCPSLQRAIEHGE